MRRSTLAALVGVVLLAGPPATLAQTAHTPGDPWEHANRFGYTLQDRLNRFLFHPLSVVFRHLAPGPIGKGVHNVLVNLSEPSTFVNDLLQLRMKRAGVSAVRFIANSTIGVLGLFDIAGHAGLAHQNNEFGVTLGRYGVRPGPYMYIVLVGPTTVRDLIGSGVDFFLDPLHWLRFANQSEISYGRIVIGGLDTQITTEAQLNALLADATDPYATLRSVYLQNKEGEIHGGGLPVDTLPSFDDPAPAAAPAAVLAPSVTPAPAPVAAPEPITLSEETPPPAPPTLLPARWRTQVLLDDPADAEPAPAATETAANDRGGYAPAQPIGD